MARGSKIEVRLSEAEKASWQAQAESEGTNVSGLIRWRMRSVPTKNAPTLDLDSEELTSLHGALELVVDDLTAEEVATWRAYAAERGVTVQQLVTAVALHANREHPALA